jgi:hypothetical protein
MAINPSNPALINLHALYVNNTDSHAQKGSHVRVANHPILGLPRMPFVLERADVQDKEISRLHLREDAVFLLNGGVVTPPFSMVDSDELVVRLPSGPANYPIWAELIADPGPRGSDPIFDRPTLEIPRPGGRRPIPIPGFNRRIDMPSVVTDRLPRPDFSVPAASTASAMTVDAYLPSAIGISAYLGQRNTLPFAFSGPGLRELRGRGRGTVAGVRWINGMDLQKLKFRVVDVLNLPHEGGARYLSLTNWQSLCDQRRDAQSPRRRPLQDTNGAPAPAAAPGFSTADEDDRVGTFFKSIRQPLEELINLPTAQIAQMTTHDMSDSAGNSISADGNASLRLSTLSLLMQSFSDPGMASFMGYKTLDPEPRQGDPNGLVLYRLTGIFARPTEYPTVAKSGELTARDVAVLTLRKVIEQMPSATLDQLMADYDELVKGFLQERRVTYNPGELSDRNHIPTCALAIADGRAPLLPVRAPVLNAPRHRDWLPAPIDAPIRDTETGVNDLVAGATMAAGRRQPPGTGVWTSLNTQVATDRPWHALIAPGRPEPDQFAADPTADPPQSFVADGSTGPGEFAHHVAQQDRFGRYSNWGAREGTAGPRPKPPRPVVFATYAQPAIESGSHSGRIAATVPLPDEDALAPGSFPLLHAELTAMIDGQAVPFHTVNSLVSGAINLPQPPGVPGTALPNIGLRENFAGPALANSASRKMRITAVWVDNTGQRSETSEPAILTLTDPYPPPQVPIPDTLLYSARPDATGTAWVERSWPLAGNAAYAVYYADENRLRSHLRNSQAAIDTELLAALESEDDPAARATLLRVNQGRFPTALFERLKQAITVHGSSGQATFRHALSGSLRVLSGYKIVAENPKNAARPDLSTVDTVFYGVPNSVPPQRPTVTAKRVPSEPGEPDLVVEVIVTLRTGVTAARLARIRRTRSSVVHALRNPVIGTALFGPTDPDTGLQTATFRDIGAAQIAPAARFAPFVNYSWIAEAQGAPEPGSAATPRTVEGRWGPASAPVTLGLVPDNPPDAPSLVSQTGDSVSGGVRNLTLTFDGPADLAPTSTGSWSVTRLTLIPDAPVEVAELLAAGSSSWSIPGDDDSTRVLPAGTRILVFVTDPLGRQGGRTEVML